MVHTKSLQRWVRYLTVWCFLPQARFSLLSMFRCSNQPKLLIKMKLLPTFSSAFLWRFMLTSSSGLAIQVSAVRRKNSAGNGTILRANCFSRVVACNRLWTYVGRCGWACSDPWATQPFQDCSPKKNELSSFSCITSCWFC